MALFDGYAIFRVCVRVSCALLGTLAQNATRVGVDDRVESFQCSANGAQRRFIEQKFRLKVGVASMAVSRRFDPAELSAAARGEHCKIDYPQSAD